MTNKHLHYNKHGSLISNNLTALYNIQVLLHHYNITLTSIIYKYSLFIRRHHALLLELATPKLINCLYKPFSCKYNSPSYRLVTDMTDKHMIPTRAICIMVH